MNTEGVTNGSHETGSVGRMRTVAALQPGLGFMSVVGMVGVAVVLLGAFSSQAMMALAFFAALFLAAILIKISPRIVFLGLVLGYFLAETFLGSWVWRVLEYRYILAKSELDWE